ncbi:MAG TPA: sialidase family protein [Chloroflexota bacterium]
MARSTDRRGGARLAAFALALSTALAVLPPTAAGAATADTRINVGSPTAPFSQNKQNEPALAVDANHPNVLVAGANDNIDEEACNAAADNTCPFTAGVGVSGVYFSFDSGATWSQPTYKGLTARSCLGVVGPSDPRCTPSVGPIGTLPKYFENGLASSGDPGLAFGPRPVNGSFAWANGSRLYYANLTANLGSKGDETFRGPSAIAVSRTDDVAAAAAGDQNAWRDPVLVSSQSSTTFSDKEQIWADNAASSPFFGNVYVCWASFRSDSHGLASPQPLMVATSTDGGDTWTQKQVTPASNNPFNTKQGFGRSGCTVRTDSHGTAYVFANQFGVGTPGQGAHLMITSSDGGKSWSRPVNLGLAVDTCFLIQFDGTGLRCVMDGVGGARDDLSEAPSVDIANGAPTGADATDEILRTWVDGRDGVNHEHTFVSYSTNGGATWSAPAAAESAGDRGYYSAIAISPSGADGYLVYNAFTTPLDTTGTHVHALVGVVKHADIAAGVPGAWTEIHRGQAGDARGSSQNNLWLSFLGDYVYAVATRTSGSAVWNDVRNAADCPAIDAWRIAAQAAIQNGTAIPTKPAPQQACPAGFGNSDIYGGTFPDPTP